MSRNQTPVKSLILLQFIQVTLILMTRSVVYRTGAKELFLNLRLVWDWQHEESSSSVLLIPKLYKSGICLFMMRKGTGNLLWHLWEAPLHVFIWWSINHESFMVEVNPWYYPVTNIYIMQNSNSNSSQKYGYFSIF